MFKIRTFKFQVVILVYIDDLVILGSTEDGVKWVNNKLRPLFKLTDLGEIKHYLGVSLEREGNVMILHQAGY